MRPDDPDPRTEGPSTGDLAYDAVRKVFWDGRRKTFTLLWIAGALLFAVACLGLGFGRDDHPSVLSFVVFCVGVVCVGIASIGDKVLDVLERRRG